MKPAISITWQISSQLVLILVGIILIMNSNPLQCLLGFLSIGIAALIPIVMPMKEPS